MAKLDFFGPRERPKPADSAIKMMTYIYLRESDGKCVHVNASGPFTGKEYEHDDPNWQPPPDWPYKVKDLRKEEPV